MVADASVFGEVTVLPTPPVDVARVQVIVLLKPPETVALNVTSPPEQIETGVTVFVAHVGSALIFPATALLVADVQPEPDALTTT